jgi:hypothetical protein
VKETTGGLERGIESDSAERMRRAMQAGRRRNGSGGESSMGRNWEKARIQECRFPMSTRTGAGLWKIC